MTKEPRMAVQFPTRKSAAQHAALIGWPVSDARPIEVMGFKLWTIMDDHTSMLTWPGYTALLAARGTADRPECPCAAHRSLRVA